MDWNPSETAAKDVPIVAHILQNAWISHHGEYFKHGEWHRLQDVGPLPGSNSLRGVATKMCSSNGIVSRTYDQHLARIRSREPGGAAGRGDGLGAHDPQEGRSQ
eukprot:1155682-Pelagomonas_calceolata.AAC.1